MALQIQTSIEIWKVRGVHGMCFASKLDAEAAARAEFPDENSDLRYARIHYVYLCGDALSLRELAFKVRDSALGAALATQLHKGFSTPGELSPLGKMLRAAVARREEEQHRPQEPEHITEDAKIEAEAFLKSLGKVGGNDGD